MFHQWLINCAVLTIFVPPMGAENELGCPHEDDDHSIPTTHKNNLNTE